MTYLPFLTQPSLKHRTIPPHYWLGAVLLACLNGMQPSWAQHVAITPALSVTTAQELPVVEADTDTSAAALGASALPEVLAAPVRVTTLPELLPFRAEFRARYNGKAIGRASIELRLKKPQNAPDAKPRVLAEPTVVAAQIEAPMVKQFHMLYRMKATRGFASFVGANLREEGHFAWDGQQIQPQGFQHQSKAFFSKTKWHANFSPETGAVQGQYEGDDFNLRFAPGTLDPLTQFIHGAQQSLQQVAEWSHLEVMKGELREYAFSRDDLAALQTDCAELKVWRVMRSREESKASQEVWYSPALPWVPVQIRNVQKDGDVLQLELTGMMMDGALYCGVIEGKDDN